MKFNELTVKKTKNTNRVGRGISAGQGKTAGRGTKGQGSRSGGGKGEGFAGGQTPMMMRAPKLRGFRAIHAKAEVVYTGQLNAFKGNVDNAVLAEAGVLASAFSVAKLITKGAVTAAVKVSLQGASQSAKDAVVKAGGSFTKVDRPKQAPSKKED
jgi:large subunit ribosomal protein L15